MEKNQNVQRNQPANNKEDQQRQVDGTKKEINPNNPTANQNQGERKENQNDSSMPHRQPAQSTEKVDERSDDGTHGASKAGDSDAAPKENIKGGL